MGNIIRLGEHIICSEVEDAIAVWFSASRKFMLLEEPAFFVLKQITENELPRCKQTGYLRGISSLIRCKQRGTNPKEIRADLSGAMYFPSF